ncbi:ATP-binding protein [Streptomyces olivaceiscleroticus]|uniref:ATP-binding protein n=1 Tax=Streptomyces olivaceiscleroticus TaxID=68245 RepID=A0ABN1ATE8_9ACTN
MSAAPPYRRDAVVGRWPRSPRSVPRARAALRKTLAEWGLSALEDRAALVLTELLTNAVRHAHVPRDRHIQTRICPLRTVAPSGAPGGVRIEVHDAAYAQPRLRAPGPDVEYGRGLVLVAALAERWGCHARPGPGKVVWAEVLG